MKMKKRALSLLLTLLLVVGLFPASFASAQETEGGNSGAADPELLELLAADQAADAPTAISRDRDEGIKQIQTLIPDGNFAAAVYDALFADGHLGAEGQDIKEVLATFEGKIDASGYVKKTTYTATLVKINMDTFDSEDLSKAFDTQEEAQAWLDSFQTDAQFAYPEKNKKIEVETIRTTEQKPKSELIHSIEGIQWLRLTDELDLNNNYISDITLLSLENMATWVPEYGRTDTKGGKSWFGAPSKNLDIVLTNNPIQKLVSVNGGQIYCERMVDIKYWYNAPALYLVKPENNPVNWSGQADIEIPLVEMDGKRMNEDWFTDSHRYDILNNLPELTVDLARATDVVFPITGISHSQSIIAQVRSKELYYFMNVTTNLPDDDTPIPGHGAGFWEMMDAQISVYMKAKGITPETTTTVTMNKVVTGTTTPAPDTQFQLYTATLADGQYTKGQPYQDKDGNLVVCTTNENGQFTFSAALPVGDYCFVETKAGPGLVLDSATTYGFSVGAGGTLTITGGVQTVEPSDGSGPVNAGEGAAFIDRYSPDVQVQVTPDPGMTLDKIVITYFDREAQADKTLEVTTAREAADWINDNKGDEDNVGVIDGTVTLKPLFKQEVQFEAENDPIPPDPGPDPEPEEKTGSLTVSKTVSGNDASTTKQFTFTVTLADQTVNGKYGDMEFVNGVATFTLAHGQSKTASGLPADTGYAVTEAEADQDGYQTTSTGSTGTIEADKTASAAFTNTKEVEPPGPEPEPEQKTGNLTVSKTVSGNDASTTKQFTFTVTLADQTVNGKYGDMEFVNGVSTFTLAHGQSKTASGLPAGVKYTVAESDNSGYTVTSTGESGIIPEDQTAQAAFNNHKERVTPGGGGGGDDRDTSVTVKKVWKLDDGGTAPASITVALMRDGKEYKTVELNEANGWKHTWNGLSDRYNWTVEELDVPDGFTVSVDKKGTVITITNDDKPAPTPPVDPVDPEEPVPPVDPDIPTEPEKPTEPTTPAEPDKPETPKEPDKPHLPQTGQLWLPAGLLAAGGVGLILAGVFGKKKYHGKHEA